ncbi:MAG: hypothetical protein ACLQU1_13905 [Bryobacteraceae bacterium]
MDGRSRRSGPRFTIKVDKDLTEGSPAERQKEADEAATMLLSLPWEPICDGRAAVPMATNPLIRVLLVSPRPADQSCIDHRASALPLVEALSGLGERAEFKLPAAATFEALKH